MLCKWYKLLVIQLYISVQRICESNFKKLGVFFVQYPAAFAVITNYVAYLYKNYVLYV